MKNSFLAVTVISVLLSATAAAKEQIVINSGSEQNLSGTYDGYSGSGYGGVAVNAGSLNVLSQSVFWDNSSLYSGGAISNSGILTVEDYVRFESNQSANAGALANTSGTANIGHHVSFINNSANYIGAVLNQRADMIIGDNVLFRQNTSLSGSGAALGNDASGRLIVGDNAEFIDNHSAKSAGAIYQYVIETDTTSFISIGNNALFEGNSAQANGGAVGNYDGLVQIGNNAVFNNNSAEQNGGAIMNDHFNLKLGNMTLNSGTVFENNTAGQNGGAIYNSGILTLNGAVFNNNSASEGGAVYNDVGGTVTFNGDSRFSENKAANSLNDIYNDGTIKVNGNITLDGGISGNGQITFNQNSMLIVKAGHTLIDNQVINNGAYLDMIFDNGYEGGQYRLVNGNFSGEEFYIINADNALYNISPTNENGVYNVVKKSNTEFVIDTGANKNQASTIAAITFGTSDNENFNTIANAVTALLQSFNSADIQAGLDAATALAPETAPMIQNVQNEQTAQIFDAVTSRFNNQVPKTLPSVSSFADNNYSTAWIQTLYNKSDLENTSKVKGFSSDTYGLAMGLEKQIDTQRKVGAGYAYSNSNIDGFLRSTDVDTHTMFIYGEYRPNNHYINAILSYGWSDYSEDKYVAGYKVKADYDVESFGLQTMTGYEMEYKSFEVTPELGFRYMHITQDSYHDSAAQRVSADNSDILTGILGIKTSKEYQFENTTILRPELRFALTYDMVTDDAASTVILPNGASYRIEGESLNRFGMEFDAGVTAYINEKIEVLLGYEGKFRNNYEDHTALLSAKYKF